MIRQIEMSIFDIVIHMENGNANDILNNIRNNISIIKVPEYNRFQNAFSHIFSGGYAAGYYSYKWAEVLSANVFDVFEKNGVINPDIGNRYANTILAIGSSKPAMDAFREFVGAEPDVSILLKGYGLL
jgi:oligopeptidase A